MMISKLRTLQTRPWAHVVLLTTVLGQGMAPWMLVMMMMMMMMMFSIGRQRIRTKTAAKVVSVGTGPFFPLIEMTLKDGSKIR